MWKSFTWDDSFTLTFGKKISDTVQVERMYGSNPGRLNRLLEELKNMM